MRLSAFSFFILLSTAFLGATPLHKHQKHNINTVVQAGIRHQQMAPLWYSGSNPNQHVATFEEEPTLEKETDSPGLLESSTHCLALGIAAVQLEKLPAAFRAIAVPLFLLFHSLKLYA